MHRNANSLRGMGMGLGMGQGAGVVPGMSTLAGSTPQMSASSIPRKRALAPLDVSEAPSVGSSGVDGGGYSPESANLGIGGLSLAIPSATQMGHGLYKYEDDPDVDLVSSYDSATIVPPSSAADVYPHSHFGSSQTQLADAEVSPVDGSLSTSSGADDDVGLGNGLTDANQGPAPSREGLTGASNFMNGGGAGNPGMGQVKGGSNNFVAKLYQCVSPFPILFQFVLHMFVFVDPRLLRFHFTLTCLWRDGSHILFFLLVTFTFVYPLFSLL